MSFFTQKHYYINISIKIGIQLQLILQPILKLDTPYFSITTSKSFFKFIQDFMQKKRKNKIARIPKIPATTTMYKIMHMNFTSVETRNQVNTRIPPCPCYQ